MPCSCVLVRRRLRQRTELLLQHRVEPFDERLLLGVVEHIVILRHVGAVTYSSHCGPGPRGQEASVTVGLLFTRCDQLLQRHCCAEATKLARRAFRLGRRRVGQADQPTTTRRGIRCPSSERLTPRVRQRGPPGDGIHLDRAASRDSGCDAVARSTGGRMRDQLNAADTGW